MLVEYLFEMSPWTLGLIMLTFVFIVSKTLTKTDKKEVVVKYEEVPIEFKKYQNADPQKKSILVMSYNIMAYNFTKYEWFPHCDPRFLETKYRAPRIIAEIENLNADVLCLQECDHDLFLGFYKANLESLGYNTIFNIVNTNRIVTNIIAYKKNVFQQENWEYLDLNEGLDKLDDCFHKHKEALIINLTHYESKQTIQIVNTHLFWNPEFEYVKYGQISKILNHIQNSNKKNYPIILCGDFNATPSSNVLKYIYKQTPVLTANQKGDFNKNKKYIEKFYNESLHNLSIRSAYDCYKLDEFKKTSDFAENHPDFTTYTDEFIAATDYILFTEDLDLLEILKVPTNNNEVKSKKLPNAIFPSDHLKIAARFELKSKK